MRSEAWLSGKELVGRAAGRPRGVMAAAAAELGGRRRGAGALTSTFIVLTLDIPLIVQFHAPAPLLPLRRPHTGTTRRRDMSRDRTPEAVWRTTEKERVSVAGRNGGRADRLGALSRPRWRFVCAGNYCSVGRLSGSTCRLVRPQSATDTTHAPPARRRVAGQPLRRDDDVTDWRQSQLRRFLDAPSRHGDDVTDDDDDDDWCASGPAEELVDSDTTADSESAMQRVRQLVARCRLPVSTAAAAFTPQPPRADALHRRAAWTRALNHPPVTSSVTSQSVQQAILAVADDLVSQTLIGD